MKGDCRNNNWKIKDWRNTENRSKGLILDCSDNNISLL